MEEKYCKCGCGLRIAHQKAKKGQLFYNYKHARKWIGANVYKGRKYGPRKKKDDNDTLDYSTANKYCVNYDNENIQCVMCFENGSSDGKECFKPS